MIVVNDNFDYDKCYREIIGFVRKYIPFFKAALDELCFAYICRKFNLSLESFDPKCFNAFPHFATSETRLIHFMGDLKPWNSALMQSIFPKWIEYYNAYIKAGGTPSPKVSIHDKAIGSVIRANIIRDRWENFFLKAKIRLPKSLISRNQFANLWCIFDFNETIYYEFKMSLYNKFFWTGMWCYQHRFFSDGCLLKLAKYLSERPETTLKFVFVSDDEIKRTKRLFYVVSEPFLINNVKVSFNALYKETFLIRLVSMFDEYLYKMKNFIFR